MSARRGVPIALGAVALLALLVSAPWSPGGQRVDAIFQSVPGLVAGADVRAGGIRVGNVQAIHLDHGLPRVTLRFDGGYRVRQGARADVRLASLSGEVNRYVAVAQGSGSVLPDGALLGPRQTDQPVEVDDVLATLDPTTRREARALLRGLAAATRGRGGAIAAALRHSSDALGATADALGQVTADGPALQDLVRSAHQITASLASDHGATGEAVARLASVVHDTASEQSQLAAGLAALPAALRAPTAALTRLQRTTPTLRTLVRALGPGARELRAVSPELRELLVRGRPALDEAAALVREAPGELRALPPLLASARAVLPRLSGAVGEANPVLDDVRVRLPDFFSFFSNWADFTANYDANGHAARVGLVFTPAPLNPIGPEDSGGGHLAAPFFRDPGVLEGVPWRDYRSSFVGSGG